MQTQEYDKIDKNLLFKHMLWLSIKNFIIMTLIGNFKINLFQVVIYIYTGTIQRIVQN